MSWRQLLKKLFHWHPPSKLRDTAWLDGLRGLAAFEVMISHYQASWGFDVASYGMKADTKQFWRLPIFRPLYFSGNAMVPVFFVISGYVLTCKSMRLLREGEHDKVYRSLGSSVFRRYLRLYAPALFSAVVSLFLVYFGIEGQGPNGTPPNLPTFWAQFKHWLIETERYMNIFNFSNNGMMLAHRYVNVLWTIPMEYMGSVIIYLCLLGTAHLSATVRNHILHIIGWLALAEGHWMIFCFTCGAILADIDYQSKQESRRWHIFLLGLGYWILGTPIRRYPGQKVWGYNLIYMLIPERFFHFELHRTIYTFAAVMLVFAVPRVPLIKRFLEGGFCQHLAKLSFSVYLIHVTVFHCFALPLRKFLFSNLVLTEAMVMQRMDASEVGIVVSYIIWFVVMLSVTLICAAYFERIIDAPTIRFAKAVEEFAISCSVRTRDASPLALPRLPEEIEIRWMW